LYGALRELAAKTWRHPISGAVVHFATATIESWFYAARDAGDPVNRRLDSRRGDRRNLSSLASAVIATLRTQYDAHPGWNLQRHFDNMKIALGCSALPFYPSLWRYLRAHGIPYQALLTRTSTSPGALAACERLEQLEVHS
jgi:putative transposase